MLLQAIQAEHAPAALGTYSQAIKCGNALYLSGQLPINPLTLQPCNAKVGHQLHHGFANLRAVSKSSGGDLAKVVKLNLYLTDLTNAPKANQIMAGYFSKPYPARAAVGVASMPQNFCIEAEAIRVLD
ncbi:Rid family detoxifying hydrolase [Pseudomonas sp. S9]|uniref:Reactive intermediate/imine deaminase n=2 Tax=Pseudomonas segetis TaxID=298908 RepID=A0A239HNG0_9PSED|nr:Rid family detoxifying hydrolase [Pseudomonas sp. S9]SNS82443.1 reactive intermediate/imine deaminase [Pseudomonas segetis]